MDQFAVWATMEAREGKEEEARAFLVEAARRLESEPGTTSFRAMQIGTREYAIFNSFVDEAAVEAHVNGPVAAWVQERNPELFTAPYAITRCQVFAAKRVGADAA
ncbi:MAG TPA: antibiotic biosynthesis monooxygenase [Sphingopyxis sp.]|nr:antibiotic biosynthesis monooxygenase [Sphingopyxis sp.]HMP45331.1 antibiotic biosynthesis monooxygenase [Sphingopyxis sp.]HMQ18022.1 antibiotic biosynthesis monooxygenase [Sphingopyxis sp.]